MKKSFSITFTYTVWIDEVDHSVNFQDQQGRIVASWNTTSWNQWGDVGILPYMSLAPEYIEERKQAVLDHAIELYKNSYPR